MAKFLQGENPHAPLEGVKVPLLEGRVGWVVHSLCPWEVLSEDKVTLTFLRTGVGLEVPPVDYPPPLPTPQRALPSK